MDSWECMQEIIVEFTSLIFFIAILLLLWIHGRNYSFSRETRWRSILLGFALMGIGAAFGVVTELVRFREPVPSSMIVFVLALLRTLVGHVMGAVCIGYGLWEWLPRIVQEQQRARDLKVAYDSLKKEAEDAHRELSAQKQEQKKRLAKEARVHKAERMEAIALMSGGVAHDLNNILSGIINYPDIIQQKIPEESNVRPYLEAIRKAGHRASKVVSDMLTMARGITAPKESANLNVLISTYLASPAYEHLHEAHPHVHVVKEFEPNLRNIMCSPKHINICLMNLISNAVEASGRSGQITLSTNNIRMTHDDELDEGQVILGDSVLLSISDTGPGISEKNLNHFFEPFYARRMMGKDDTGLGLAIVWHAVHDHGGEILVKSNEHGSTFDLYFPVIDVEEKSIPTIPNHALDKNELRGNGAHVLIVDDEEMLRIIATNILQILGYQTDTVESGEAALSFLERQKTDLVLLDITMPPGMDGCETYERIKERYPAQKALIVSGRVEDSLIQKMESIGLGTVLPKPYSLTSLGQAVKNALEAVR